MSSKTTTKWIGDMSFEWDIDGYKVIIDADESVGGKGRGPKPKPFMLSALGGCTSMDVVSILRKMRVLDDVEDFQVHVSGELSEEHPKHYINMHVVYEITAKAGKTIDLEKVEKAVKLSEENYCGVSAVYKKIMPVTSEII